MDAARLLPISTVYASVALASGVWWSTGPAFAARGLLAGVFVALSLAHGGFAYRQVVAALAGGDPGSARRAMGRRKVVAFVGALGIVAGLGPHAAAVGLVAFMLALGVLAGVMSVQSMGSWEVLREQAC